MRAYYILESGVGALTRRLDLLNFDFDNRTRAIRSSFLFLFMLGAGGLLYFSARVLIGPGGLPWKATVAFILLVILTAPLAFGASIQPRWLAVDTGKGDQSHRRFST